MKVEEATLQLRIGVRLDIGAAGSIASGHTVKFTRSSSAPDQFNSILSPIQFNLIAEQNTPVSLGRYLLAVNAGSGKISSTFQLGCYFNALINALNQISPSHYQPTSKFKKSTPSRHAPWVYLAPVKI